MSDSIPCLRLEGLRSQGYCSEQYVASRMAQIENGPEGDCDPKGIFEMIRVQQQMGTGVHAPPSLHQQHNTLTEPDIFTNETNTAASQFGAASQPITAASTPPGTEAGVYNCPECWRSYRGKSAYTSYLRHRRTGHSNTVYKCPYCEDKNRRTDNLAVHVRTTHPGAKVPKGRDEWVEYQIPTVSPLS